jgi:hypothetical protein
MVQKLDAEGEAVVFVSYKARRPNIIFTKTL